MKKKSNEFCLKFLFLFDFVWKWHWMWDYVIMEQCHRQINGNKFTKSNTTRTQMIYVRRVRDGLYVRRTYKYTYQKYREKKTTKVVAVAVAESSSNSNTTARYPYDVRWYVRDIQ